MTDPRTLAIIDDLRKLPAEAPWAEFKENNSAHILQVSR